MSARLAALSALLLHDLLPKVVKMVEEEEGEAGARAEPNHHGAICLMKNCQKAASSITRLDPLHGLRFLPFLPSLFVILLFSPFS